MNLSFDYYHNLNKPELYLCNPDGRELFPLVAYDRMLRLRFNDLSELTFSCPSVTSWNDGTTFELDCYDYIQTRRRIIATGIGEFIITNVTETDNGVTKVKNVTCSSGQIVFQDKGVYCEDRVYYFYNPSDPYDNNYDADDEGAVPSVVGQLYQQLGIQIALSQGRTDPAEPYDEWTITYINSDLSGKARNFTEETCTGYEWLVQRVEEAFECVVLFDFRYKTIQALLPTEATEQANVLYTFSNFMKEVKVEEDASDVVTVLKCLGNNCDITSVNPTGTNYICDFSYYMDDDNRWMSSALKAKLADWQDLVESQRPYYVAHVTGLRADYQRLTELLDKQTEISTIYTDLDAALAKCSIAMAEGSVAPYGIIWCETVEDGATSMDANSRYKTNPFSGSSQITAYKNQPIYASGMGWYFSGSFMTGTAQACYENQYCYFSDQATLTPPSYCFLEGKAVVNPTTYETEYTCGSFKRYAQLDAAATWKTKYDARKKQLETQIATERGNIDSRYAAMETISSQCNILNYFANTPALLRELGRYWIEGEYTNNNIAVTEDTSHSDMLKLEMELLEAGQAELSKVCQPKLQFSITSVDCTKLYEFRAQMTELALGKIITIEKKEGLWYYPALLEMEYNLDTSDTFSLTFANALRLDDWGYTYGDLISNSASVSKQVGANWQNILDYSKNKVGITNLIMEPLSATLRAAFANLTNQEFTIDDTGILGRKFASSAQDSFSDEQMRIVNNMIIFTDDNWATAKAALGKITFQSSGGSTVTSYGLVAETLIGSLLLGQTLEIRNSNSSVIINDGGIAIKDSNNNNVLLASTDGSLTAKGNITANAGYLGGVNGFTIVSGAIYTNNKSTISSDRPGIFLGTTGLYMTSANKSSYVRLYLAGGEFEFGGTIYATGGKFNGDGIEVRASNGQLSFIDNLGVDTLFVSDSMASNTIYANRLKIGTVGTGQTSGIAFRYTQLSDEILSNKSTVIVDFTASVNVSISTSYVRFTVNVGARNRSTSQAFTMPQGQFVKVQAQARCNFGEDYGGVTTLSKVIEVYVAAGENNGTATVDYSNVFRANGTVVSTSIISISPSSVTVSEGSGYYVTGLVIAGNFVPGVRNTYDLGTSDRTWKNIYSETIHCQTVNQTSDQRLKSGITYDIAWLDNIFNKLKPAVYSFKGDLTQKRHFGFIAQDVADALGENGMSEDDFGIVRHDDIYSLDYSEFTAMNVWEIQRLKERVAKLEEQLKQYQQNGN